MSDGVEPRDDRREAREVRTISIGEMTFRVTSSARGGSTSVPFVLVHGIGTSHRYMIRLHDQLAATADVHSVDLPGFGGLPKMRRAPDVADMAEGIGALLTLLDVKRAVLVGHSMGAQWVVEVAAVRPDLVTSVVAIGPVADDEHRTVLAQSVALGRDVLREPPAANVAVLVDYLRCGPFWYSAQLRNMLTYRIEQRVAALAMPLLVIRGGSDPIAGLSWCRRLVARAPRGSLAVVPHHRHVVQFSAPRAVASAIHAHLTAAAVQPVTP